MPFYPGKELERLEEKVANSKAEDVSDSETFQARAAIKAKGWNPLFIEDAISRGFKRRAGEEVGETPWAEAEERQADEDASRFVLKESADKAQLFLDEGITGLQRASEISRRQATEEDEDEPRRVPPVRYNLLDKESQEQEKVREEEPEKPVDNYWDCPNCTSVNVLEEDVCPTCNLDKSMIEMKILELVGSVNTGLYTKDEHIRFLNDIIIIRRRNKRWMKFVSEYMEKNNLKPEDMAGLIGPKPWEENMDAETLSLQPAELEGEIGTESRSDKELLGDAVIKHFEEKDKKLSPVKEHIKEALEASSSTECPKCDLGMVITGEHTGSWVCPECGWNIGYPEGESVSLKFLQDNVLHQEERDPIPALDKRMKVIVSEEAGWLCLDCNRVWPYDFDDCATCKLSRKATDKPDGPKAPEGRLPTLAEYDMAKKEMEGLEMDIKCTECSEPEVFYPDPSLADQIKNQEDMSFDEKAKLLLQLKAKEKEDAPAE